MTPDEIRDTIATNPQSEAERAQLINEAIQNNMADEIPNEWTVKLTDQTPAYDDTEDLIADQYQLEVSNARHAGYDTMLINAHESGAMSIAIRNEERSGITPLTKFDIATADRLIQLLVTIRGVYLGTRQPTPETLMEPTTGITFTGEFGQATYCYNCGARVWPSMATCPDCGARNDNRGLSTGEQVHNGTLVIPDVYGDGSYYIHMGAYTSLEEMMDGLTSMANSAETASLSQQEITQ